MSLTVAKNEYEVPCEHPMCETLHRRYGPGHEVRRTEWVILSDGERTGIAGEIDPFETKREALAFLRRHTSGGSI